MVGEALRMKALLSGAILAVIVAGCGQSQQASENGSTEGAATQSSANTGPETTAMESTANGIVSSSRLDAAANDYERYVVEQVALLEERTQSFAESVVAGDVERAKELYAPARVPWERVEPIAEQLGDYDPNIDAREGDVPEEEWRGFHRIEKALWERNTTEGQKEYARQLLEDVKNLRGDVEGLELDPVDLVNGSVELLNEVSAGKITGEEERYSHTDLYDVQANVEGAEKAFEELKPTIVKKDRELAINVEEGFSQVHEELDQYRQGDGWVSYEKLGESERRSLSQKVDALAEPLSRVGQALEQG